MPLFDNPLHKGKGLSGSGSQSNGNNDSQNDYDNPPVLGYYYGDDDELYFYSNNDYYGNSYVSDDYDNLLNLVTFDHDDNDYAYPINAPYGLAYYTNKNEQNSESSWWDTGKYLTPIYGDWLSFKEAESGWDYALAVVGIVPSPWTKGAKGVNVANKARKAANKAGDAAGGGSKANNFANENLLNDHFIKHGSEFNAKNADEYLKIGQDTVNKGIPVQYNYNGSQRTGYVQFLGNDSKGQSKFIFVGTNEKGNITTIHTKSGKDFWKTLNNNPNEKIIYPKD